MSNLLTRVTASLSEHYRIERELGRGGMAVVFLADDLKHHRKVAVKVLHPDLAQSIGAERFLKVITIAAQLTHSRQHAASRVRRRSQCPVVGVLRTTPR